MIPGASGIAQENTPSATGRGDGSGDRKPKEGEERNGDPVQTLPVERALH